MGIGVFRRGLCDRCPLADGSLLEAEAYASEERSVLIAGVSDVVLEGIDHTDVGTDTEVDLAEFKSGRGVQTHIEALVDAGLEGIDLARGRETVGEVGASFDRYSEVLAERYSDTEINGYADVVETVAILRDVLEAFLAECHPRGEVDARGEPDFGSKAGVEAQADFRFGGDAYYLIDATCEVSAYFDTGMDFSLSLSGEDACNESEGGEK